ncbi:MAG: hypothetical protein ACRCUS_02845, partial [Anaerovoracaceae bacterium]
VLNLLYPPVFKAIWELMTESAFLQDDTQLAIGLPRGYGKTTVVKLYILYLICYTQKRYIMITALNQGKAEKILGDVKRLFSAPNIRALFGNILSDCETNNSESVIFNYNGRLITIQALGAGGDPRGSNVGFSRPDVIISDDIQSRDEAFSVTQSAKLKEWYEASLLLSKSEKGCLFIYIGNMYPTDGCLLKQFRDSPDWISFIAGAILSDGESIWPEFKSTTKILAELQKAVRSNTTSIFFSEILNDSTQSGNVIFDPKTLLVAQPTMDEGKFIVIDPAGRKATSDDTAIGVGALHDGIPYLVKMVRGKFSPLETITKAINLAGEVGAGLICVENYAYQESLLFWFEHVCTLNGIYGLEFQPINRGTANKNSSILSMFKQLQAQEIGLYPEVVGDVLTDIVRFNPQTTNNKDDLLDILVYLPMVVLKYRASIGRLFNQSLDSSDDLSVRPTAITCSF